MADGQVARVSVLYSPAPREVLEWEVVLAPGATVLQALQASGLAAAVPDLDLREAAVGIWGRKARLEQSVRDRDRVEVYRPLKVDPSWLAVSAFAGRACARRAFSPASLSL